MGDIADGVKIFDEMIPALREFFDCLRQSGFKLSAQKCDYGTTKIDYLGNTFTPIGISLESAKIEIFSRQIRMLNTVKQLKRLIGFKQLFRKFLLSITQKLLPFYKFLRKRNAFTITDDS